MIVQLLSRRGVQPGTHISTSQDQRRQKPLMRELQASLAMLEATMRETAQQEYVCQEDAEAATAKVWALQSAYHQVEVVVEERPKHAPGRLGQKQSRAVKGLRYGTAITLHEPAEVIGRKR